MMTHQEVADFVIDVFEARIYDTPLLGDFYVVKERIGWTLCRVIIDKPFGVHHLTED